jgi:hypothetical protein
LKTALIFDLVGSPRLTSVSLLNLLLFLSAILTRHFRHWITTVPIMKTAGARSKTSNGLSLSQVLIGAYLTPTTPFQKKSGQRSFLAGRDGLSRTFCKLLTSSNDSHEIHSIDMLLHVRSFINSWFPYWPNSLISALLHDTLRFPCFLQTPISTQSDFCHLLTYAALRSSFCEHCEGFFFSSALGSAMYL